MRPGVSITTREEVKEAGFAFNQVTLREICSGCVPSHRSSSIVIVEEAILQSHCLRRINGKSKSDTIIISCNTFGEFTFRES
jgi:hypothetical protein